MGVLSEETRRRGSTPWRLEYIDVLFSVCIVDAAAARWGLTKEVSSVSGCMHRRIFVKDVLGQAEAQKSPYLSR